MKIYFGTDHAGFEMKEALVAFVRDELGLDVEDCGAHVEDITDDYPDFISVAAHKVAGDMEGMGIVIGASGQGEAIVANRVKGVRAVVYYGAPQVSQTDAEGEVLDLLSSTRAHNDANVLSLGARFLTLEDAKTAVSTWLTTPFSNGDRHVRRINKIDA